MNQKSQVLCNFSSCAYTDLSMGGGTTPDQVGPRQEMGDACKNIKGKRPPQKKKGWTPKAIATPKFEVSIEELKGYVFDLHGTNQAERFNRATKEITEYVDWELNPLAGKALCDIKVPIISNPKKPYLAQGEPTMDNVDKAIFQ